MIIQDYRRVKKPRLIMMFILFIGCASHISKFDYIAYENAISLKVEALYLMTKATNPFDEYANEVEQLKLELEKAYEYSRLIPLNEITTQQWELMKNPENNLLGGFFKMWEEQDTIPPFTIEEIKKLVSESFDEIIELEIKKIK